MRAPLRWTNRLVIAVVGLLVLSSLGFLLWPVQPLVIESRNLNDASIGRFGDKVGWYDFEDGTARLISFGETDGITLNRFAQLRSELEQVYFEPSGAESFVRPGDSAERIEFQRDEQGGVPGISWNSPDGVRSGTPSAQPPYAIEEVRYPSADLQLVGLLLRPPGTSNEPAVVFIHGSGVSHRNVLWYLHQADYLARQGITVLLPDKRGAGKSAGTWHDASFDDYAQDAVAAVQFLDHGVVAADATIGIIGISQGAWVAPLVARREPRVGFVVAVSGSLRLPRQQLQYEIANDIHDGGAPRGLANLLAPLATKRAVRRQPTWWQKNGDFDPLAAWQALQLPTLFLFGERDQNVDVDSNLARLRASGLAAAEHVQVQVFERLGHALMDEQTGWIHEDYLSLLVAWISNSGTTAR